MADRPILFSAPMVRAILAGTKTQTRRVVHNPNRNDGGFVLQDYGNGWWPYRSHDGESGCYLDRQKDGDYYSEAPLRCPYGKPGERLWVREAWRTADTLDPLSPSAIADKCLDAGYRKPWAPLQWEADGSKNKDWSGFGPGNGIVVGPGKLRPGMFMPRWASRITLEVTGVRVERLQDISEADALAEGIVQLRDGYGLPDGSHFHAADPRVSYWSLWDHINGPGSVAANPWVWCGSFRRITCSQE